MSDIIAKLTSNDETVSNLELLDEVIAFQLSKIQKYNKATSNQPAYTISEDAENSMSNLIELLKLRENYRYEK